MTVRSDTATLDQPVPPKKDSAAPRGVWKLYTYVIETPIESDGSAFDREQASQPTDVGV
jgi:hypothetical protein